jgi:hypothetical protein
MLLPYFDEACTQLVACAVDTVEQPGGTKVWASDVERFNGTTGETRQKQLWLKNADATVSYTGITITATGEDAARDLEYAPDNAGVPGTWAETLNMADGAYTTATPFWARCILASGTPSGTLTGTDINVACSEVPAA